MAHALVVSGHTPNKTAQTFPEASWQNANTLWLCPSTSVIAVLQSNIIAHPPEHIMEQLGCFRPVDIRCELDYERAKPTEGRSYNQSAHQPAQQPAALDQPGRFSYNEIHRYLRYGSFLYGFTKAEKSALRKRTKYFTLKGPDLFYTGGPTSKSEQLVIY